MADRYKMRKQLTPWRLFKDSPEEYLTTILMYIDVLPLR
jgi:hypothetical protein